MGKPVSATEFKAKCLALIDEMERSGEPLVVTRRGKTSITLTAQRAAQKTAPLPTAFGMLRSDKYRFDDPFTPAADMDEWEANNPAELYSKS